MLGHIIGTILEGKSLKPMYFTSLESLTIFFTVFQLVNVFFFWHRGENMCAMYTFLKLYFPNKSSFSAPNFRNLLLPSV